LALEAALPERRLAQPLLEGQDRAAIRYVGGVGQLAEALERRPREELELQRLIGVRL